MKIQVRVELCQAHDKIKVIVGVGVDVQLIFGVEVEDEVNQCWILQK